MAKKISTADLAVVITKATLDNLSSTLYQKGLDRAQEKWQELNDTYSENDWWPPVARAKRKLFDNYKEEQEALKQKEQEERRKQELAITEASRTAGGSTTIVIGGNQAGVYQQPNITMQQPHFDGSVYDLHNNENVKIGL